MIRTSSFCKKVAIEADDRINTERAIERLALSRAAIPPGLSHGALPAGHAAAPEVSKGSGPSTLGASRKQVFGEARCQPATTSAGAVAFVN